MAGIGFELKKLFRHTGVFASLRAFGYATVITTGPMLLGVVLILGLMGICVLGKISSFDRELLICMITYVLLASVTVTSYLSMVVTRFTADMLFEERYEDVLPSFWGSALLMMVVGGVLWLVFLLFSGATFVQGILLYVLFQELILVWHAMSYLTAIKDYRGIFRSFFVAIGVSLLLGLLLVLLKGPAIESLLFRCPWVTESRWSGISSFFTGTFPIPILMPFTLWCGWTSSRNFPGSAFLPTLDCFLIWLLCGSAPWAYT